MSPGSAARAAARWSIAFGAPLHAPRGGSPVTLLRAQHLVTAVGARVTDSKSFRLDQSAVNRSDFIPLRDAVLAGTPVDASNLVLDASHVAWFRNIEQVSEDDDRPQFDSWLFDGTEFGAGTDFSKCAFEACSFEGCHFSARTSFARSEFSRAVFNGATFGDDANFERVEFGQKAEFHGATFGDRARFKRGVFVASQFFGARFGENAAFTGAKFSASARFHGARFGSRASFTEVRFPETAEFGGSSFGKKPQMVGARFAGSPSFLGASFGDRARLKDWEVAGTLDMQSAQFHGAMSMHGTQVGGDAIFEWAQFEGSVDLGGVEVGGDGRFYGARFVTAERLGPIEAAGCLLFRDVLISSACVATLGAKVVDFSDSRFLAPIRLIVKQGHVILDRLATGPKLVISTPPVPDPEGPPPRLVSIRHADIGPMVVSGLDVKALRFAGADGIDSLHIESGARFQHSPRGRRTYREVLAEEHRLRARNSPEVGWFPSSCAVTLDGFEDGSPGEVELARIYRGLRKAREDARDAPGAADFYYGEMEMRRLSAYDSIRKASGVGSSLLHLGNIVLLELYRRIGGYGVRPGRPFVVLLALILAAALYVDLADLIELTHQLPNGKLAVEAPNFETSMVFVLRSALLLPTAAATVLSAPANWIQIAARLLGPLLLGLFVFGLRARIHR